MREEEIKKILWKKFLEFMKGQTVGIYPDGKIDYYSHDVDKFLWKLR